MPRARRVDRGGLVYHVLNRANGRLQIFKRTGDFVAFEQVLAEGLERFDMRLCGYCIMNTHWHLVLWPRGDGELSHFMKWATATHTHRWHAAHGTVGIGHVYQGRYKSFPVQTNAYYLALMRYVESNPRRAGLVQGSVEWPWSSLAVRCGMDKVVTVCDGPVRLPERWRSVVDSDAAGQAQEIGMCIQRGRPLGDAEWVQRAARELALESTLRPPGRPRGKVAR